MPTPIPMILHCPTCGAQHIDAPEPEHGWTNPPHRSHLCGDCGTIWRPAAVPTVGVHRLHRTGHKDTWPPLPSASTAAGINLARAAELYMVAVHVRQITPKDGTASRTLAGVLFEESERRKVLYEAIEHYRQVAKA